MKYRVEVTKTAKREVDAAYRWLADKTSHAAKWFNGLMDAVESLTEFPTRWPVARENRQFGEEIRQLLYGKKPNAYRVLFVVRGRFVYVLHVRHAARRAMRRIDVIWPDPESNPN